MGQVDERIRKDVADQLYWDSRVAGANIEVDVDGPRVVLTGRARTYGARRAAHADALAIPGVREVDDRIVVSYPPSVTLPSDSELATNMANALCWHPDIDEGEVRVRAEDGVVTLEGCVDASWKKPLAERVAGSLTGVTDIDNRLTVAPAERASDEDLARAVMGALERQAVVEAADVSVAVDDAVVTLSGEVSSCWAREAARQAALLTRGVVDVDDCLEVAHSPTVAS